MDNDSNKMDEETKFWLEEKLLPNLKLALNQKNSVLKYEVLPFSIPLIMSSIIFLETKFTSNEEEKMFSLVVKRPSKSEIMREFIKSDEVFHNEILFYSKYSKNSEDYPRCFYTLEDPPTNSVIVIENISKQGYQVCPQMVNLDMKYILAAMQEIGRFHAKAYVLKNKSPKEFFQIVDNIQETRYKYHEKNNFPVMMNHLIRRVIKRLRERNYDKAFCEKAEKFFNNAFENIMLAAVNPQIPLATLCHGDFTRNNIFFKEYHSNMKAMLFDFALITYGSPAIDLSTFIYLSVSREDIKTKFTEMFDAYHDSVVDYLKKVGFSNLQEFSKDSFLKDYKRNALFGYMIASFFLPALQGAEMPDMLFMASLSPEELLPFCCDIGGDKFTENLTEMLLDMRESGCLDHILA